VPIEVPQSTSIERCATRPLLIEMFRHVMALLLSPPNLASPRAPVAAPEDRGPRAGDDLVARLGSAVGGLDMVVTRAWPQLRYVELTFPDTGEALLPPSAWYLVVAAPLDHHAVDGGGCDTAPSAAKTMFVRAAAAPWRYAWQAGHRATFVSLDASTVAAAALETGIQPPSAGGGPRSIVTRDHVCTHLLQVLREEASEPMHAAQTLLMESVASALALRLLVQFTAAGAVAITPPVAGELTACRFARVRDHIRHNLGDAITLEDLARVAGVSRFHFARQFRARTGESPMSYLVRTRVERAKTLLQDSRARVIDISAELGFADQSHFARTFRRLVGMPPRAYARAASGR
jgi:AraC family transcriptional regulator